MKKLFSLVLTCCLLLSISQGAYAFSLEKPPYNEVELEEFEASPEDYLLVDLANSTGYLLNPLNRIFVAFPVLSGRKQFVRYMGRSYFAATPERTWIVKEKDIQRDRVTFSESGDFLRLTYQDQDTSYGIHGHKYFQTMLDRGNFYISFGCVLVADDVLDVIEKSFLVSGKQFTVITTTASHSEALLFN